MNGLNDSIYSDELQHPALPSNIIDDNEMVALALASEDGLVKKDGYARNRVDIPVGMVVTNRRIAFAAVDSDGSDAGEISYSEIAGIELEEKILVLKATDGVEWRFPLANPNGGLVDIALRHLLWVGDLRSRLVSMSNDIELEVGKIESMQADHDWSGAIEKYRETRAELDDLISTVYVTDVLANDVLAPELPELDRELEMACTRLYISRAHSRLELAKQILEYDNFDQAQSLFEDADENYRRATWHSEEVLEPDTFMFGEQRELSHELDELKWEIESTAAEPLQQAKEATVQAQSAKDIETKIDHMETARRKYRGVLTMEWDETQAYTGDQEETRAELQQTTTQLIELHEQAARNLWNDGSELESHGDVSTALETCSQALTHLERAHELAEEYDPELAGEFQSRLKQMFELYLDMREQAETDEKVEMVPDAIQSVELDTPDRSQTDDDTEKTPEEAKEGELSGIPETGERPENAIPSIEDLSEMDTHHEITLDIEDTTTGAVSTDDDSSSESESATQPASENERESSETQL
jgi:hypothetical protein